MCFKPFFYVTDSTSGSVGATELSQSAPAVPGNMMTSHSQTCTRKRRRTNYNESQLEVLEHIFTTITQYPDFLEREDIADKIGVSQEKIQVSLLFIQCIVPG